MGGLAVASTLLERYIVNSPLGVLTGVSAMMFYLVGDIVRQVKCRRWIKFVIIVSWLLALMYGQTNMDRCSYAIYPLDVLGACGGTFVVYKISKFIQEKNTIISNFLSWCGRNSLVILCMHYLIILLDPNTRLGVNNWLIWMMIDFSLILSMSYLCTRIRYGKILFQIK